MKKPITLLRCPLCGGKAKYKFNKQANRRGRRICNRHQINCPTKGCSACSTNQLYSTVRQTKTYWNESVIKWQSDYIDMNNPYDRARLIKMTMGPQPPFILAEHIAESFPIERPSLISEWGTKFVRDDRFPGALVQQGLIDDFDIAMKDMFKEDPKYFNEKHRPGDSENKEIPNCPSCSFPMEISMSGPAPGICWICHNCNTAKEY